MPDVSEDTKMPDIRGLSFCNLQAKEVVNKFWELYVSIFDSDDRRPLMDAYHDASTMSMMAAYGQQGHVSTVDPSKKLSYYLGDSRNLTRVAEKNKRFKLLHQGKLDIVAFLTKLPKTTHDPNSYLVDMPVAVENFILFTVTGLYKERDERSAPYRFFSRTFTLVPQNGGFVIINEMLYVTNPTHQQIKNAFRPPPPTPSPSPIPHVQSLPVVPLSVAVPTDQEKHNMLIAFMQQSGMNEQWSRDCLEQNAWDFGKSAVIFTQLKEQNKIPQEAFVK